MAPLDHEKIDLEYKIELIKAYVLSKENHSERTAWLRIKAKLEEMLDEINRTLRK